MDDDALMLAVSQGDSRAFEELVNKYNDGLIGWLRTRTQEAEDISQEVFLKVLTTKRYEPRGRFKSWLFQLARNLLIDRHRKYVGAKELDNPSYEELRVEYDYLRDALDKIPKEQCFIIRLYHSGVPLDTIAEGLNVNFTTAKSRYWKGIGRLRKMLKSVKM